MLRCSRRLAQKMVLTCDRFECTRLLIEVEGVSNVSENRSPSSACEGLSASPSFHRSSSSLCSSRGRSESEGSNFIVVENIDGASLLL